MENKGHKIKKGNSKLSCKNTRLQINHLEYYSHSEKN